MKTFKSFKSLAGIIALAAIMVVVGVAISQEPSAYASPLAQTSPLPTPPPLPTPLPTAQPPLPTPLPTAIPPTSVPPTPVPPTTGTWGYHTVRPGETLFCIGRAYVVSPWAIASQNGIGYPYYLRIGQVLTIPNAPWANMSYGPVCQAQFGGGMPPVPQPPVPQPPSGCRAMYTVRPGDTLSSIAWRYGSTVWAIATRNKLPNPNLIFPGQVLCIP